MFCRSIFLAVALVICLAGAGSAQDWDFWGHVTYINCNCSQPGDQVKIVRVGTSESWQFGIDCFHLGYNSGSLEFPTGSYQFHVLALDQDCKNYYQVIQVYHIQGTSQRVDLKIGPPDTPDGGDE